MGTNKLYESYKFSDLVYNSSSTSTYANIRSFQIPEYPYIISGVQIPKHQIKTSEHHQVHVTLMADSRSKKLVWATGILSKVTPSFEEGVERYTKLTPEEIYRILEKDHTREFFHTGPNILRILNMINIDAQRLLDIGNYFRWNEDKLEFSYVEKSRLRYCPWTLDGYQGFEFHTRKKQSLGGILKLLGYNDRDVESAVNRLKMVFGHVYTIDEIVGEELRHAYYEGNYAKIGSLGTLAKSCMRYARCQPYLDLYARNPNISMIVSKNDTGILGRALVFKTTEGKRVYGRVYGSDVTQLHIIKHLKLNDVQSFRMTDKVSLDNCLFNYHPYLDNFPFLSIRDAILSPVNTSTSVYYLRTTDGTKHAI